MGPLTQEDPIGIAGGLNLYGYANGDPINFSDPFGLCPCVPALVGLGFGLATDGISQAASGQPFSWRQFGAAGVSGAVAGQFAILRAGRAVQVVGQGTIAAAGSAAGGADRGTVLEAAAVGGVGEVGGQVLEGFARTPAFSSYLNAWGDHQVSGGASLREIDRFKNVVDDLLGKGSALAGVVAGWVQGLRDRPVEGR